MKTTTPIWLISGSPRTLPLRAAMSPSQINSLDSSLADDVNAVVQRATAKNPAHRYADILEMAAAFREAAALSISQAGDRLVALLTPREQEILKLVIEG